MEVYDPWGIVLNALNRVRAWLLGFAGYLVPFVQSLPSLGIWAGLMTLPFATYLVLMVTNLPASLLAGVSEFFTPFLVVEKAFLVTGLTILLYSMAHLRMKKRKGLVTSGPYRLVRHPQYLGIILLTMSLTSSSVWILHNTFGTGFLDASQTIGVWFIEVAVYVLLALVEERFLSRNYGKVFDNYKRQVPFLVPFLKTGNIGLDVSAASVVPPILLFTLINVQM